MAKGKILSLLAMEKLMKNAGAYRVGEDAKEALRDVLEDYAEKVSKKADELSRHARRSTIKSEDIKLASKGQ
ncbi:NFYB/HAP3 family transcription factor subunit [Candidatus Woesearchaeota archaeon]|nr:NFYB/HAP3 family transcription factor subunit [Candidatus Woesearchaeota archaeon]